MTAAAGFFDSVVAVAETGVAGDAGDTVEVGEACEIPAAIAIDVCTQRRKGELWTTILNLRGLSGAVGSEGRVGDTEEAMTGVTAGVTVGVLDGLVVADGMPVVRMAAIRVPRALA